MARHVRTPAGLEPAPTHTHPLSARANGCMRTRFPIEEGRVEEPRWTRLGAEYRTKEKNHDYANRSWGVRSSGLTLAFKALADFGQRVVSIKVNGKEIEPDGHYSLAGCEREGEALDVICRHPGTHDAKILRPSVHEALIDYLKTNPIIAPRRDGREGPAVSLFIVLDKPLDPTR